MTTIDHYHDRMVAPEQSSHASEVNEQSASGLVPHRLFHESGEAPTSSAPRLDLPVTEQEDEAFTRMGAIE